VRCFEPTVWEPITALLLLIVIPGNTTDYSLCLCLDDDNHVLLSSFDETVIQHGAEFNLGLHKYAGDNFSPKGHKYIREYSSETVPRTLYRVGGVIFSKEKVFSMYENRIMIKYTLEDAHSATTLRFRPFLAFRSVKNLTQANGNVNQSYEEVTNGIKTCMYPGYPELYMQFNKKVKFVYEPYWYNGIEYPKEQERGYPYQEDLYVPGYFEVPIKKGETIIFSAGDSAVATTRLKALYENEVVARTPRTSFFNCLKNSAQQFYFRPKEDDAYLLAGYPWFKVRARDLFVALPGSTLSIDDPVRFEKIMHTAMPAMRAYMENGRFDAVIREIEHPDVFLWAIWAIQQYAKHEGVEKARELYGDFVKEVIDYIRDQKHPDMKLMENGLLFANGKDKAITWMNSTVNGKPVVTPVVKEATALGAAIIAGYGVGIYPSIAEGAAICAKVDKTYTPNLENKKVYDEMYPVWREVYKANLDLCDRKLTKNMWIAPGL
jgi:predicted glycogen debranching enzyme